MILARGIGSGQIVTRGYGAQLTAVEKVITAVNYIYSAFIRAKKYFQKTKVRSV